MPTRSKKSRAPRRPRADASCTLSRRVEWKGLQLDVWTCSEPTPQVNEPTGDLYLAPLEVFERVGRRKWRFFFVDPMDARRDAEHTEPGWYFQAANPDPMWMSNDALGPYDTLEDAYDDCRAGVSASQGAL